MADELGGTPAYLATITTDADGWFQSVSPSFLTLIDRPIEALAGLNLIDLVHPHDAPDARRLLATTATGNAATTTDLRMFTAGEDWTALRLAVRGVGDGRVILDATAVPEAASVNPAVVAPANERPTVERDPFAPAEPDRSASAPTTPTAPSAAAAPQQTGSSESPLDATEPIDDYLAQMPGDEVPMQRAAIRARVGSARTPMIEIDNDGRTTFVGGEWDRLFPYDEPESLQDLAGEEAFERLLTASDSVESIMAAIGGVLDFGLDSKHQITVAGVGARWVHILSIPSPARAGVVHALVAVVASSTLGELDVTPVAPPPVREASAVPPAAIQALGRITKPATPTTVVGSASAADQSTSEPSQTPIEPSAADDPESSAVSLKERFELLSDRVRARGLTWQQAAAAAGVVLLALLLRTWDLSNLPTGFHGDEAVSAQEGNRVLSEGLIGVYTGSALGQPTAPFYIHAIFLGLFGDTIWATRIVAALAGVLSVGATYLVMQRRFDHSTAIASALALGTMTWSLHFSRIGFGVAWWPLAIVCAIAAIDRATQLGTSRSWMAAGAAATFGIYVYNSHWAFGLAVVAFMAAWLVTKRADINQRFITTLLWGPIGAAVVGLPMFMYAIGDNGFTNHFSLVSRRSTPEWTEVGFFGKVSALTGWYVDTWKTLVWTPISDGGDASGIIKQVPLIFVVLGLVGVVETLRKHRNAFMGMVLLTLVVLPVVPALTINGLTRRHYGIAPCIAILAGIGAIAVIRVVRDRLSAQMATAAVVAMAVVVFFTSIVPYFTDFRDSASHGWIFAEELTATAAAVDLAEQDGPVFVNWFSARHNYDYPTLSFLMDGRPGANRTPVDAGFIEQPPLELTEGVDRDQLYVLIGDYRNNLEQLQGLYPEGSIVLDQNEPPMVAFEVPLAN